MRVATPEAVALFHQGAMALAEMEHNGIKIDVDYVHKAIRKAEKRATKLEEEIRSDPIYSTWKKRFGSKTNIGSNPQLGVILYEELGYKSPGKTAKFRDRTDLDALADIELPFIQKWVEAKRLRNKVITTYLKGLLRTTDENGYLHTNYNLHIPQTFRSSADDPNLQNVPIRDPDMADMIRKAFICDENEHLVEADFGGIEVRVAACYCKDKVLIDYVCNSPPKDMHRDMAMEIFLLEENQVGKKTTRDSSKNQFVFPQFYGSDYVNCAQDIWKSMRRRKFVVEGTDTLVLDHLASRGIRSLGSCDRDDKPRKGTFEHHLQKVQEHFWQDRFFYYAKWKKRYWQQYLERGWLQMYTGFVCHGNLNRKQVTNYPIQGSAFHCLLWSVIQIRKELKRRKMKTKLALQIHDSVIARVPKSELAEYIEIVKKVMTQDLPKAWKWIIVPLEVEVEVAPLGASWYEKKKVA